jgi:chemotaxis signal transduction protein
MKIAKIKPREASVPVLVTAFDTLNLALPMNGVQKVTHLPQVFRSGSSLMGVGYVDDREIIVVDLHYHIYGQTYPRDQGYLVKLQRPDGNLYGILVATLPVMQDIPLSSLRALPADYRNREALGIASHVAAIQQNQQETTVFLMDFAKIIAQNPAPPTGRELQVESVR